MLGFELNGQLMLLAKTHIWQGESLQSASDSHSAVTISRAIVSTHSVPACRRRLASAAVGARSVTSPG